MAVVVKNAMNVKDRSGTAGLLTASFLGAAFVAVAVGLTFYAVPALWSAAAGGPVRAALGEFMDAGLMLVAVTAVGVASVLVGGRVVGPQMVPGSKTGAAAVLLAVALSCYFAFAVGNLLKRATGVGETVGIGLMAAAGILFLYLLVSLLTGPKAREGLVTVEEQGWFSLSAFKRNQGQRVRRLTMLGILVLAGWGVATLINNKTLEVGPRDWTVAVPFVEQKLVLLKDVRYTLPLLLALGSLWLAYRVVNMPVFADFLIATEAELNKVNWASRKRLIQDTIVVLVTLVLFTVFLLFADLISAWGMRAIGVLPKPSEGKAKVAQQEQQW